MDLWTAKKWIKRYDTARTRHGVRLRCDKNIDSEVRRTCKEFCRWLRLEYEFPVRVPIYLKASATISAMDGEQVSATFFGPYDKYQEPYIRVAVGDYQELLKKRGKDDALASYICSIAHELTHYFQWLNGIELTAIGEERQASRYASLILEKYAETREHP